MRYLLDRLGMSSKYKGYRMLLLALEIALRDEDNLTNIFQRIYTPVAERCGVTPVMVDKNLRSIIDIFWRSGNRELYRQFCGFQQTLCPTNAEFLEAVVAYTLRNGITPSPRV